MIRAAVLGLAALAAGASALAAQDEGGPIRGGEHDGFTRVVMTVDPTTEWSLETGAGQATILFPARSIAFGTAGTFDKIPRTRITGVRAETTDRGTLVTIDLGCDCRVSTAFVGARYLAIDVSDRDAPAPQAVAALPEPPAETPAARTAREAQAVATAEQLLIRQIERAASQGLVELSTGEDPAPRADPAEQGPAPRPAAETVAAAPPPDAPPQAAAESTPPAPVGVGIAFLDEQEQIEATTVFDRDSRAARARAAAPEVAAVCLPDDRLDVGGWSNGLPLAAQLPPLRRRLVGEFDAADPAGVRDLARLYVRFGFGAEAEALLAGFAATDIPDRAVLVDLARTVEGRPATPDGPLAAPVACPGRHGLWQALGGVAPAFRDAATFAAVQAEFEALPTDLRALLAPGFVERLIAAGRPAEARVIHDTAVRPGEQASAALDLAAARLAIAEGRPLEAARGLGALVETGAAVSVDALEVLARLAVDADLAIPDRVVTDLRAAALQYRGSAREPRIRALLAEALASRADLGAAIREAEAAIADLPDAGDAFAALAVRLLAEADPDAVGHAAYAAAALAGTGLLQRTAPDDPARTIVAGHLVALGLPDPALQLAAPAAVAGNGGARLVAASGELRLRRPDAARATLGPLDGPEAAALRARSFALADDFGAALATLADRGMAEAAGPYAWPAGDWTRARAVATDPRQKAMAAYMSVRNGAAPPPAAADDPTVLDPAAAFLEPLPALDRPSLSAARRLLATGGKVEGFVEGVLADE